MIAQIVEGVGECLDRTEIRGVPLDQQVVQRVLDVRRELQRVVVGRPEARLAHPELILDLLPRLQDVHQPEDDDARI